MKYKMLAGVVAPLLGAAAQPGCEQSAAQRLGDPAGGSRGDAMIEAKQATWKCTGTPCPWGASLTNYAVAWPASVHPVATRLGYTTSPAVYAPAQSVNAMALSIGTGTVSVHAGAPSAPSHRLLATVAQGQSYQVTGLAPDEVLSVQSEAGFRYRLVLADHRPPPPPPPRDAGPPPPPPRDAGPPPPPGAVIHARRAQWRCNKVPGCFSDPWPGAVIPWPAWSARQSNGRPGNVSRSVFASDGTPLYPYMGAWAEGCEVTAEAGTAVVIEWQHGAADWRRTVLHPGESHVIHLVPPENGAMIEGDEGTKGFSVSLRNCTPQRIEP
jgi:hypothetical protein